MTVRVLAPEGAALETGAEFDLEREESRYAGRVRRQTAGASIEVMGPATIWEATLVSPGEARKAARVRLGAARPAPVRARLVHVLLGVVERSATLEAMRHATALDAHQIVLVRCERSQHEAPNARRIDAAIDAARRQCGRVDRPRVLRAADLASALALDDELPLHVAAPGAPGLALEPAPAPGTEHACRFALGPEGGFAPQELESLSAAGGSPFGLGPWVLRTELALAAVLALVAADHSPRT